MENTAVPTSAANVVIGGAGTCHGWSMIRTNGSMSRLAAASCPVAAVSAGIPLNRLPYTPAHAYVAAAIRRAISRSRFPVRYAGHPVGPHQHDHADKAETHAQHAQWRQFFIIGQRVRDQHGEHRGRGGHG
jgi:hypothetical protein